MKVLIISHNPLSEHTNMGKTLSSLFSGFQPEELCQLYIYPTVPNARRCSSYFRITDKDALMAAFTGRCPGGELRQVDAEAQMFERAADARLYRSIRNRTALCGLLRDSLWRRSGWYSEALRHWLDCQNPDVIFTAPGGAKFLYDFALHIKEQLQIPIVTYLCDEYYFVKTPSGLLKRRQKQLLQKKMETLLANTAHLVTICPELASPYKEKFAIPVTTLMTGSAIPVADGPRITRRPVSICYFGNLSCGRYRALAEIGKELDALSRDLGAGYRLKIYTAEQDPAILSALKKHRSVELCGFLSGNAFTQTLTKAQLLLHVEAFDKENRERVKHSVSTKIADSLACGVPLLAYGPDEVASMAHLRRNDCAILATEREALRDMLLTAFSQPEVRRTVAQNGLQTARAFHDNQTVSRRLREIFEGIL